jgi:hypothetical protein
MTPWKRFKIEFDLFCGITMIALIAGTIGLYTCELSVDCMMWLSGVV